MSRPLSRNRDDRGVVALEVVLAMPILLVLIVGTVMLGSYLRQKTQTVAIARDGARAASLSIALPADIVVPDGTMMNVVGPPCPDPTDATKSVTVQAVATVPASLRSIPFVPVPIVLPETITESVTMRCGG